MNDPQQYLGDFNYDNPEGYFFATENKDAFVRFYDTGFREYISSRPHQNEMGEEEMKWFVSIGYEEEFSRGEIPFDNKRQAEEFANNRDDDTYHWLGEEARCLMERHKNKQPKQPEEYNPGF